MKPEIVIKALRKMSMVEIPTGNISFSNFLAAVEKLDATGSNWVLFQSRFLVAMEQKEVYKHFDGTSKKLVLGGESPTNTELKAHTKELAVWQKKECLAHYLLIQKLPDSTDTKYMQKTSMAEMWEAIVMEFMHKSMHMQSNLHTEFMGMRYQKGANLQLEFNRVRVKYETLLNVGIKISDNNYHLLIINFVPLELSSILSQMSINMKHMMSSLVKSKLITMPAELKGKIPTLVIDPEDLMQAALEEWDRWEPDKQSRSKSSGSNSSSGTALATVSSEKPGVKSGSGKSKQKGTPGECWNCSEKGHKRNNCPNPKVNDKEYEKRDLNKSKGNSNKEKGNSSGSSSNSNSNKASSSSKKSNANAAIDDNNESGAWAVTTMVEEGVDDVDLIEFNADKSEPDDELGSHDLEGLCKAPGLLWSCPGLTLGIYMRELYMTPRYLVCFHL